jgi:hypothetical protein
MKKLTKNDLKKVIADLKRNLENLFACGFYSEYEYNQNKEETEYLELTLN